MIQARKVQPQDLTYICQNSESLGFNLEKMSKHLENMMVIIKDNEICGIGFYVNVDKKCLINWLHIKKENRRGGLGSMLLKTMLNAAERNGATEAYMPCNCEEFSRFLRFKKVDEPKEIKAVEELYYEAYGTVDLDVLWKASLIDYFRPCSCNHNPM